MLVHEYLIAPYAKRSMRGSLPREYVPTSNKSILEANKCPGLDLYALHYGTTGGVQAEG